MAGTMVWCEFRTPFGHQNHTHTYFGVAPNRLIICPLWTVGGVPHMVMVLAGRTVTVEDGFYKEGNERKACFDGFFVLEN